MKLQQVEFRPYIHYGIDLEKDVIGICLIEKSAFSRTYGMIDAECFYSEDHQKIFGVIAEMYEQKLPIDLRTVTHHVIEAHNEQLLGGNVHYVLAACMTSVVSSAHLEYHCHLIREMWKRREVLKLKGSLPEEGWYDPKQNIEDINDTINKITGGKEIDDWRDMSEIVYDLFIHQHEMASGKKTFVTTGFRKIDERNGGFGNGQMIVIGARPSVGKSALMGKMAISMAKQGKKVGIISLEMNNTEIAARLSSLDTGIEFWKIYRTIASDEQLHRRFYDKISRSLVQLPIYVSDSTKVNMTDIRAKAMKLKKSRGCDVLMLDYLQLVDTESGKQYNREQQVSQMSRGIKLLAMEMDIPVIALCQLNRQSTSRTYEHRFPKLSDLRESGSIEQDADVVLFLHRDFMMGHTQDEHGNSTERKADLIGAKWRNGATFQLPIGFDPEKMNFFEDAGIPAGFVPVNYSEPKTKEDGEDLPF